MSKVPTLREVHKTICETIGIPKENAMYRALKIRPGHGSITPLLENHFDYDIFQFINTIDYLMIFNRHRLIGDLILHSDGLWFRSSAESVWCSRLLIPSTTLTDNWKDYLIEHQVITGENE